MDTGHTIPDDRLSSQTKVKLLLSTNSGIQKGHADEASATPIISKYSKYSMRRPIEERLHQYAINRRTGSCFFWRNKVPDIFRSEDSVQNIVLSLFQDSVDRPRLRITDP